PDADGLERQIDSNRLMPSRAELDDGDVVIAARVNRDHRAVRPLGRRLCGDAAKVPHDNYWNRRPYHEADDDGDADGVGDGVFRHEAASSISSGSIGIGSS